MSEKAKTMEIRGLELELVRPGPAHNQLLSPLTTYLALCGAEGPVTVHLPFEHNQLLTRLERLRYMTPNGDIPPQQREAEVRELGEALGKVLGEIPSLLSEIGAARCGGGLVHLRLSLSAFELALVPFELAIAPDGLPGSGAPLFLQSRLPITITREVRRGQPLPVDWNQKPRILFAFASPDLPQVPAEDHLEALRRAIESWVRWEPTDEERVKDVKEVLTVLPNATLAQIRAECSAADYTHVHILAHGAQLGPGKEHHGLVLCGGPGTPAQDIVDGESLAMACIRTSSTGTQGHRPTVVTLATCDSGNAGTVITPGGSIAHALHAAGIPWVIASQFPLWMRASSMATESLYTGLLRGDDPRWALHATRQRLRTDSANTHDWASIVAYAVVPWDFDRQVDAFRNRQIRAAIEIEFDAAQKLVESRDLIPNYREALVNRFESIRARLDRWCKELDETAAAHERSERLGLSAACEKRIAIHLSQIAPGDGSVKESYQKARDLYRRALEADPSKHWVLTQYLSCLAVRADKGEFTKLREAHRNLWIAARQIAELDLQRQKVGEGRAWALGSLAELELLGVVFDGPVANTTALEQRIEALCADLRHEVNADAFAVFSTRRQFERYRDVWQRDDWASLAATAIEALGKGASWVGRHNLPDKADE